LADVKSIFVGGMANAAPALNNSAMAGKNKSAAVAKREMLLE
jgi:hypothetical protein